MTTSEGLTLFIDIPELIVLTDFRTLSTPIRDLNYTANLFLPFALLLLITLLPPLLDILFKNPWVLSLFLLWG